MGGRDAKGVSSFREVLKLLPKSRRRKLPKMIVLRAADRRLSPSERIYVECRRIEFELLGPHWQGSSSLALWERWWGMVSNDKTQ